MYWVLNEEMRRYLGLNEEINSDLIAIYDSYFLEILRRVTKGPLVFNRETNCLKLLDNYQFHC